MITDQISQDLTNIPQHVRGFQKIILIKTSSYQCDEVKCSKDDRAKKHENKHHVQIVYLKKIFRLLEVVFCER